jgi:intracellular multiplication protein IcmD
MAGAIAKFKQHKNNPQQVQSRNAVAQLFIAAALIFIPSISSTGGGTLFGSDSDSNTGVVP